jgi:hypothetical protein
MTALKKVQLDKAEAVYKKAFEQIRDPRSDAYKRGVLAALVYRYAGIKIRENCPYQPGTAEFDAFTAGCDEGHRLWREEIEGGNS